MTQIASVDYANLRIHLHLDTVTAGFDPAAMQKEYRTLRRTVEANRRYDPMVSFSGNESKGGGNFTSGLTLLRSGVRIVPYDTGGSGDYNLDILNEILNIPDEISDRDVFDRSSVLATVNIDPVYPPVGIREVATGGALTAQQDSNLTFIRGQMESVHNGWNMDDVMRLILGVSCGKMSGPVPGQAGTVYVRDPADTKNIMEVPVDEHGYRIGPVVYNP